ncbi:hypothetical protein AJ80_04163 [Polytolypa hystricis UAMH7299]|uniref:NmrA-like domain-containing protein n=1 Tax=Polytolypa hystricis (strain UAMH7299) TaxID=1447883 RepID=A0A2B7YE85_POLH7|nr:hypothetical protein AJ80_04163 [Polytolypa hystricis UAMH7299]
MSRNICITSVDGHTGHLIAELLVTNETFSKGYDSVCALALHPTTARSKSLEKKGVKIIPYKPGKLRDVVETLKQTGADTMCLIPPAHKDKVDITEELIEAAKKANVQNICLLSSAGADMAERDKQPRLREFVDLETKVMTKEDPSTTAEHSPVIIRAGFYAENLLLYTPQAKEEKILPIPVGKNHKFAPIALGDIAQVVAHVLTGKGKHGFSDQHRGQLMVLTGPILATGDELVTAANQALGTEMKFEDISEAEAKKVLHAQSDSDKSELELLLEYYSLVREGKTSYISTMAFHDITGTHPQEPLAFFKAYQDEFAHPSKKRKI